jgi:F420H(2)-dependent quinone reductase
MTEADSSFGEEHVRRYRETNGEVGHSWQGSTVLLLTTKGGTEREIPVVVLERTRAATRDTRFEEAQR